MIGLRANKPLLWLLLLAGCGSRSGLLGSGEPSEAPGNGGTGGSAAAASGGTGIGGTGGSSASGGSTSFGGSAGSAASGGSAGTGGAAGAAGECATLSLVNPIAEVARAAIDNDTKPTLTYSSDDAEQISVAFVRQPVESPGSFTEVRYATLTPWASWPTNGVVAPVYESFAHPDLATEIATDRAWSNRFALLVAHDPGGVSFAPRVHPQKSDPGPTTTPAGAIPRFVSMSASGRHLVGTLTASGELVATEVVTQGNNLNVVSSSVLGCATSPLPADAVPYQDGWIVALGNGQNVPSGLGCPPGGVAAGPPTRIDFLLVQPGGSYQFFIGLNPELPIETLRLVPHPAGAFFVYRVASGGKIQPIRVGRAVVNGPGTVGPGDLSTSSDVPLAFDAAALGSRLVVAWGNDPAGNPPDIMLTVLDETIGVTASAAFEPSFSGPLSVIGAPNGQSLVVAWGSAGLGSAVQLARFDCVP